MEKIIKGIDSRLEKIKYEYIQSLRDDKEQVFIPLEEIKDYEIEQEEAPVFTRRKKSREEEIHKRSPSPERHKEPVEERE